MNWNRNRIGEFLTVKREEKLQTQARLLIDLTGLWYHISHCYSSSLSFHFIYYCLFPFSFVNMDFFAFLPPISFS